MIVARMSAAAFKPLSSRLPVPPGGRRCGAFSPRVREQGRRVGFVVHDVTEPEAMLHQGFRTDVQVGRFGVGLRWWRSSAVTRTVTVW